MSNVYKTMEDTYRVSKVFGGKTVNFGTYGCRDDAERVADQLDELGWCFGNLFDAQLEIFGKIVSTRKFKKFDKVYR